MKEATKEKLDYRHYISIFISIGFVACGFIFPNAICRLLEALRDFILSFAYYFCGLYTENNPIAVTVNRLPSWQLAPSLFSPLTLLPFTWEEFTTAFQMYWQVWANGETFSAYLVFLSDVLYYVSQIILILLTLLIPAYFIFRGYMQNHNNDYGKDSKFLKICKRISDFTYRPIKDFVCSYVAFVKEHFFYVKIWLWIWAFHFNFITIFIEFLAFYFYFVISFDFLNVYRQVYKLLLDLTAVIRFIPTLLWGILIVAGLEYWAHQIGYNELNHRERKNRGFWNEGSIVKAIYATMGAGKTELMTDGSLSCEVELRDRAFDVIVECDFCFPYFPWVKLERELKIATAFHVTYDLPSVRRWIRKKYGRWAKNPIPEKLFSYDFERYGLYHNDRLKVENVWEVIEDYACAYFIYAVQCSLIISNYSIRSDVDCIDFGNFPRWNTDFFHRDPLLMEAFSRRSHILDFDMLRFGKRVLQNNPNRHALGFGVWVITEIDKERKNNLENKAIDPNSEEANQKNDLFNPLLKMIRHAVVVRNRVFIILLCDLQRPEDWGAGGREVGNLYEVVGQSDVRPVLPFWAPFWIFEAIFLGVFSPFINLYYEYRVMRADNTVPIYGAKGLVAKLKDWYTGVYNTFGSIRVTINVESGRMDGVKEKKYVYKNVKKIRSERYGTACLSAMFERYAEDNKIGIMDLDEYVDKMARDSELRKQHSYMQDEHYKYQMAA